MFLTKAVMKYLLLGVFFTAVTALAAPTSKDHNSTNSGDAIRTHLQPDLTLKSGLSPALAQATTAGVIDTHRSCRCGCGGSCQTDADCGPGGICEPFPSCCAKQPGKEWPQEAAASSSGIKEAPVVDVKCK